MYVCLCAANHHQATVPQMGCACGKALFAYMTSMGVLRAAALGGSHYDAEKRKLFFSFLSFSISVSGVLQGGPRLMAIKADWRQEHHTYLAFSFPTEGTTSVLDIQGTHFQPIHLPGLDPNSPSLLLEALPGGWLVQVTPEVVAICTTCRKTGLPCCC